MRKPQGINCETNTQKNADRLRAR